MHVLTSPWITITLAYWLAGHLALGLAIPPGYTPPFFPSAGIALAFNSSTTRSTRKMEFVANLMSTDTTRIAEVAYWTITTVVAVAAWLALRKRDTSAWPGSTRR